MSRDARGEAQGLASFYRYRASDAVLRTEYDSAVDTFAFGMVLFELLAHAAPWDDATLPAHLREATRPVKAKHVYTEVCAGRRPMIPPEWEEDAPSGWIDLMQACWEHDPKDRPTFEQILQHPALQPEEPSTTGLPTPTKLFRSSSAPPTAASVTASGGIRRLSSLRERMLVGFGLSTAEETSCTEELTEPLTAPTSLEGQSLSKSTSKTSLSGLDDFASFDREGEPGTPTAFDPGCTTRRSEARSPIEIITSMSPPPEGAFQNTTSMLPPMRPRATSWQLGANGSLPKEGRGWNQTESGERF